MQAEPFENAKMPQLIVLYCTAVRARCCPCHVGYGNTNVSTIFISTASSSSHSRSTLSSVLRTSSSNRYECRQSDKQQQCLATAADRLNTAQLNYNIYYLRHWKWSMVYGAQQRIRSRQSDLSPASYCVTARDGGMDAELQYDNAKATHKKNVAAVLLCSRLPHVQ